MADDEKIVRVMMVSPPATRLQKWGNIIGAVSVVIYIWLGLRPPRRNRRG